MGGRWIIDCLSGLLSSRKATKTAQVTSSIVSALIVPTPLRWRAEEKKKRYRRDASVPAREENKMPARHRRSDAPSAYRWILNRPSRKARRGESVLRPRPFGGLMSFFGVFRAVDGPPLTGMPSLILR